jgi:hypothetical protein
LSSNEIATAIGITVGTLRVKCSQMGISLRRSKGKSERAGKNWDEGREQNPRGTPAAKSPSCTGRAAALPRPQPLTLELPRAIVDELQKEASSRGIAKSKLLSRLLEVVVRDDLYAAVLDAEEDVDTRCESEFKRQKKRIARVGEAEQERNHWPRSRKRVNLTRI